jgi:acyl-CoA thioesterase-1
MHRIGILMLICLLLTQCDSHQTTPAPKPAPEKVAAPATPAVEQVDTRPIILAFGDSLTAGYGVPHGSGYPELLQTKLDDDGYHYHVVNAGISGDTTSGGLNRLHMALETKPAVVILELGGNDGLRGLPVADTRANLDEMIVAFQKAGAQVILAGMTLPLNYGADYVHSFEDVFKDLAKKYKLALIPFFLEGVAAQPGLVQQDGIHPTAKGYPIVTALVWKYLEPLLKKR